ncbi:hypothetical protein CHUAL_004952 [Chamberlinius hualienensis]
MTDGLKTLKLFAADKVFRFFDDEAEKSWKGSFFFIQGADTQYGMMDGIKTGNTGTVWEEEIALSKQAVTAINRMHPKPKFFVICGDITDAFPEEYPEMKERQIADLKKVFAELDDSIPMVCVCGNHDIGNTPTEKTIQRYRTTFGDDYFSFWCGGVFFIVLNSQYQWDDSNVKEQSEEHSKWLDEQLDRIKTSGCKHAIIFQHIPWFLFDPNEGDNGIFSFTPEIRKQMLEKFLNAGVSAIFCGHYHRNAGGFYGPMEQVVTSAIGAQLGNDPHGVRIVKVRENKIEHQYYGLDKIPVEVEL